MGPRRRNKGKEKVVEDDDDVDPHKPCAEDANLKLELVLPSNAKLLTDHEAAGFLQSFNEENLLTYTDPEFIIPPTYINTLNYAGSTVRYNNFEHVKVALNGLRDYGASSKEICALGNTCPDTYDEALSLIPSLKDKVSWVGEELTKALTVLALFKVAYE